ncbi:undecaprenyl-diphosphate phosphatase [Brooklawnia cerclae]|uniref:Undecaprenyl-diphosphatase n=1 Tax=Brooklawnia cerclae TaxID=349934 RepID=A0ABX0SCN5_9ACTN|nr:undecaprenyl-diphosphate phosphatase [Brooklawnia cerclae]NIH56094.1 undecaprenyl-diphosphatase [Brooklawnia cerclae]
MGWLEAIVLGIVQGLTEFLPISSSAHQLIVGQLFFGGKDPGAAFTAVTQLGTETAVLVYFWRDIVRIVSRWAQSLVGRVPRDDFDARMGWFVIVGSLPIGILGLLFQDAIDSTLRNLWITVVTLGGVGLLLGFADRYAQDHQFKDLHALNWRDAIIYGLCQAAALIPGVSRSGGTISGGLFMRYDRPSATRYSFLLAIPAVFASGLFKLKDIGSDSCVEWGPTIVATVIAFVVGYAIIAWLLRYITTHTFSPFVIYRVALAVVLAGLLVGGVLDPEAALTAGCGA